MRECDERVAVSASARESPKPIPHSHSAHGAQCVRCTHLKHIHSVPSPLSEQHTRVAHRHVDCFGIETGVEAVHFKPFVCVAAQRSATSCCEFSGSPALTASGSRTRSNSVSVCVLRATLAAGSCPTSCLVHNDTARRPPASSASSSSSAESAHRLNTCSTRFESMRLKFYLGKRVTNCDMFAAARATRATPAHQMAKQSI